jgi:hypothetical protein
MGSPVISTRADLDALAGTPAHAEFMSILRGSLWRLEKDDVAATWRAVADDSTIARFGFVRADFPGAVAPELPEYVAPPSDVPKSVTMRQARLALLAAGMLADVNAAVAAMPGTEGDAARIEWEFAATVDRTSPLVQGLAVALSMTEAQLDGLFVAGAAL